MNIHNVRALALIVFFLNGASAQTLQEAQDQAALAFRDTPAVMAFFQKEIGVPFPWDKYYQVYCHDFLAGETNFAPALDVMGKVDMAHGAAPQLSIELVLAKTRQRAPLRQGVWLRGVHGRRQPLPGWRSATLSHRRLA